MNQYTMGPSEQQAYANGRQDAEKELRTMCHPRAMIRRAIDRIRYWLGLPHDERMGWTLRDMRKHMKRRRP
jgi:hypothetical protein